MIQTLFVSNKHTLFLCVIFFCGDKFVNIIWLYIPRALFLGQNSDVIYLVVLTLWVKVVLLYSEVYEVSTTESLSWLSSTVSSRLWAFGGTHDMEAAFPQRILSVSLNPPYLLNHYCNGIFPTLTIHSNPFWLLMISSNRFIDPPSLSASFILILIFI